MDQQQESRWRPTRKQVLWILAIVAVLTVAVLIGYRYGITLWNWLKLLIVPAVIAGGGLWFNRQQRERELEIAREQRERELEIADRRAQDEALQAYLDQLGNLLLDKDRPLRQSEEGDEVRTLARARTLTVLARMDSGRKGVVVPFLIESGLVQQEREEQQGPPILEAPRESTIVRLLRELGPRQQEPAKEEHVDKLPIISLPELA